MRPRSCRFDCGTSNFCLPLGARGKFKVWGRAEGGSSAAAVQSAPRSLRIAAPRCVQGIEIRWHIRLRRGPQTAIVERRPTLQVIYLHVSALRRECRRADMLTFAHKDPSRQQLPLAGQS